MLYATLIFLAGIVVGGVVGLIVGYDDGYHRGHVAGELSVLRARPWSESRLETQHEFRRRRLTPLAELLLERTRRGS